ncbi:MAG: phosphatase PAP2 family protein [Lachnospiraceae bacterium]|nr:phosphatase PAP2 family protein [Lachnospiraceae bacterium]
MRKKSKKYLILSIVLFLLFAVFTVLVKIIDVQPIGPEQSMVGFATVNKFVADLTGINMVWYDITDWLGFAALAVAFCFALLGLYQLIYRRSFKKVDTRLWLLAGFYVAVMVFYAFFEIVVINYRPVILEQELEASYPSSHTILIICIMVTAMIQFHYYLRNVKPLLWIADILSVLVTVVTVIGRLVSGVHWFTDIIGGILLSCALILLYCFALNYAEEKAASKRAKRRRPRP